MKNFQPIQYISPTQAASAATFARPIKANFDALSSTNAGSGSELIGVNRTTTNYSQSGDSVKDHLDGIDTKLGTYNATTIVATSNPSNYTKVTNSTQGHLLGIDTALGGKEPTLATSTTDKYYRGDKTFQILNATVVPASSTPSNYIPVTASIEGHLKGVDTTIKNIWDSITASVSATQTLTNKTTTNIAETTQTITDSATGTWNLSLGGAATWTLGANRFLASPTNMKAGATYYIIVKQPAAGGKTLAYSAAYKWPNGAAPVLSTSNNAVDILTFICDGSYMYGSVLYKFS